jgi:hypothetical protein
MENNKKYDEKISSRTQEIKLEIGRYQIMADYFSENPDRVLPNGDYLADVSRSTDKLISELKTLNKLQKLKC